MECFLSGLIGYLIGAGVKPGEARVVVTALERYLGFEPPVGLTGYALKDMLAGKKYKTAVVVRGKTYSAQPLQDLSKYSQVSVLSRSGAYLQVASAITTIGKVRGLLWYDRSPKVVPKSYSADNVAPHEPEKRWTYTVGEGKIAFVEMMEVWVRRDRASTTEGRSHSTIAYKPAGESIINVLKAQIVTNGVGDSDRASVGHALLMQEGDVLEGWTHDTSSGGSVNYQCTIKITEFDI